LNTSIILFVTVSDLPKYTLSEVVDAIFMIDDLIFDDVQCEDE